LREAAEAGDIGAMTTPTREIELKFLLDASAAAAVLAALPPGEARVLDMAATYFDTADHWLRRNGFGFRVRQTGAERIQTLKSALGADGGEPGAERAARRQGGHREGEGAAQEAART
jgi:hypothetical protein